MRVAMQKILLVMMADYQLQLEQQYYEVATKKIGFKYDD